MTLNAISGIGMLAVGTLGFPYIGALQADKAITAVASLEQADLVPGLVENGAVVSSALTDKSIYEIIKYKTLDAEAVANLVKEAPADKQEEITEAIAAAEGGSAQKALLNMAIFPAIMLACYLALWAYFQSKGGYKPVVITDGH